MKKSIESGEALAAFPDEKASDMNGTNKQLRWDSHFCGLALYHARLSKDPSTQVGSVIIGPDREILSAGFNGFPRGIADTAERLNDRDTKLKLVVHAEMNALLAAARTERERQETEAARQREAEERRATLSQRISQLQAWEIADIVAREFGTDIPTVAARIAQIEHADWVALAVGAESVAEERAA